MKEHRQHLDPNSRPTGAVPASDSVQSKLLAADTEETVTIPDGATIVKFSATSDFFAQLDTDGAITVPGDVTDGSAPELNPSMWICSGFSKIHVISSGTPIITFAFYE